MNNRSPIHRILREYQHMGFEHDLIIRAWTECRGNQNLMIDQLFLLTQDLIWPRRRRAQHPMKVETARLLKKLPRTYHLRLKFEGNDWFKYLELRKLGLISKKAFRNTRGLSLEYANQEGLGMPPIIEHMEILGNHLHQKLRKLKHLSIKFDIWEMSDVVSARPLLKSLKQTFVGLVRLKLSLRRSFRMSEWELWSFDRLFAKLGATLKHLELDFSMNSSQQNFRETRLNSFSEDLGLIIINRLHKLESLVLNFNFTRSSTKVVRLLINAAGTNFPHLKSLNMSFEGCVIAQEHLNSYSPNNLKNSLQQLKLKFNHCADLTLEYLSLLRSDIFNLCPLLNEFYLSTLECHKFPLFFSDMEKEFYEYLPLKRIKLLYSDELERDWNKYQDMESVEIRQIMTMEEENIKLKTEAAREEEWHLYHQAEMEEERAPKGYEEDQQEYLQLKLDEKERIELEEYDRIERGIRWEAVEEEKENIDYEDWKNEEYGYQRGDYDNGMVENDMIYLSQHIEEEQAAIDLAEEEIRCRWWDVEEEEIID